MNDANNPPVKALPADLLVIVNPEFLGTLFDLDLPFF